MKRPDLFRLPEEFILSMKELKKHYKKAIKKGLSKKEYVDRIEAPCLLCKPLGTKENHQNQTLKKQYKETGHIAKCMNLGCPWIVITGFNCDHESNQLFNGFFESVYQTRNKNQQQERINQLTEWIKIYKKHLKEGN